MISQRLANLVFVAVFLGASGYFAWVAEGFTTSGLLASAGLPSKFFPQLMLAIIALCAVIVGYQYLVGRASGEDRGETVFHSAPEGRQGLLMLIVAIVCYVIWSRFGFLPMAILLGPMSLVAMGVFRPLIYVVVWALTGGIVLIFMYGLGIQLI